MFVILYIGIDLKCVPELELSSIFSTISHLTSKLLYIYPNMWVSTLTVCYIFKLLEFNYGFDMNVTQSCPINTGLV